MKTTKASWHFWAAIFVFALLALGTLALWANAYASCDGAVVRNMWNLPECVAVNR